MTTTFLSFGRSAARAIDVPETNVEPNAMPAAVRRNSRRFQERFWLSSRGEADFRKKCPCNCVGALIEKDELIHRPARFAYGTMPKCPSQATAGSRSYTFSRGDFAALLRLVTNREPCGLHCFPTAASFDEYTNWRISALCLSRSAKCRSRNR